MNYYTQLIQYFQQLFTKFRRDYTAYLKSFGTKQYVAYATISFKVPLNRIPYYLNQLSAFQKTSPAGYLPAGLNSYYLKEIPVWFYYGKDAFLKLADAAMISKNQLWQATPVETTLTNRQLASSDLKKLTESLQLELKPYINNKYTRIFVNYNPALIDIELSVVRADEYFRRIYGSLAVQQQLETTLKSLEVAYNRGAALLKNSKLSPQQQAAVKYSNQVVQAEITSIKNNPDYTVKVCTDCGGNSAIGEPVTIIVIAAIAIIGALAWHAIDKYATNQALARDTAERLRAKQINADRISNALGLMQKVLTDASLTPDQKATINQQVDKEIAAAQNDSTALTNQGGAAAEKTGTSIFDRIENLLLIGGGIWILGNFASARAKS